MSEFRKVTDELSVAPQIDVADVERAKALGFVMLINNRRLPDGFKVSRMNTTPLWITVVTGFGGVGYWMLTVLPKELCKNWKLLC